MPENVNSNEGTQFGRILFPQAGTAINKYMIRNLSQALEKLAGASAKATANQENFLSSFAQIILDDKIVLDYTILAEQGEVCCVNTSVTLGYNAFSKTDGTR